MTTLSVFLLASVGCSGGGNGGTGGGTGGGGGSSGGSNTGGGAAGSGGSGGSGGAGGSGGSGGGSSCTANTMTDPMNCGRCGRMCESGGCSNGMCKPMLVLDPPNRPTSFAYAVSVSGGKIYEWQFSTAPATPTFFVYSAAVPPTALSQTPTRTTVQEVPQPSNPNLRMSAVAFDSTYIYQAAPGTTAGGVGRKKLDGTEPTGAATPLFALPAQDPMHAVTGCAGYPMKPASGWIWKGIAVSGTAAYLIGTTSANGFNFPCSDSSSIFVMSPFPASASTAAVAMPGLDNLGPIVTDMTTAGGHLFWIDNSTDGVKRSVFTVPVAGGTKVKLEDQVYASDHAAITSDGQFVYWTIASSSGKVRRCPLASLQASSVTDVVDVESPAEGLAVDDTHVYFMTVDSFRTVSRVAKAGGTVEDIGSMVLPPSQTGDRVVGVDSAFLYLSDSDGKLYRIPKAP